MDELALPNSTNTQEGDYLDYKTQKGWNNLAISKPVLRQVLESHQYELYCAETDLAPQSFAALTQIEKVALALLKKYAEQFYNLRRQMWESQQLEYRRLDKGDENLQDYVVRVKRSRADLVKQIHSLVKTGNDVYTGDTGLPPRIHFDRHLYQLLLTAQHPDISSVPPGLNDGERKFVEDLRQFFSSHPSAFRGRHIFLLRNLSRGKGIGFFEAANFYPDFILWIKRGKRQQIAFIDPKGIRNLGNFGEPKIQLHTTIKDIEARLAQPDVILESFVVSVTKYADVRLIFGDGQHTRADFAAHHVLFQEGDYVRELCGMLGIP